MFIKNIFKNLLFFLFFDISLTVNSCLMWKRIIKKNWNICVNPYSNLNKFELDPKIINCYKNYIVGLEHHTLDKYTIKHFAIYCPSLKTGLSFTSSKIFNNKYTNYYGKINTLNGIYEQYYIHKNIEDLKIQTPGWPNFFILTHNFYYKIDFAGYLYRVKVLSIIKTHPHLPIELKNKLLSQIHEKTNIELYYEINYGNDFLSYQLYNNSLLSYDKIFHDII